MSLDEAQLVEDELEMLPAEPRPDVVQTLLAGNAKIGELVVPRSAFRSVLSRAAVRPAACVRPIAVRRIGCLRSRAGDAERTAYGRRVVGDRPAAGERRGARRGASTLAERAWCNRGARASIVRLLPLGSVDGGKLAPRQ